MRRLAMTAVLLGVAAFLPAAAAAQAPDGPARIAVTSAPPAWMAGAPATAVAVPDAETREVAPEALVAVRRADRHTGVTLMIVGLAGVLTGLIVDESAITVAGAIVGGVGLFMYLH
jgi:hypothetical protein